MRAGMSSRLKSSRTAREQSATVVRKVYPLSPMATFQRTFTLRTSEHNEVIDITGEVKRVLAESKVIEGQLTVYTPHATAAIAINENDDPNIGTDFLNALGKL